jgi:hypothetical protein
MKKATVLALVLLIGAAGAAFGDNQILHVSGNSW